MATYKVIQDIEAEDKLLGPLTLRQFVYAGIVAVSAFICFKLLFIAWWLILFMLPHMLLFGVLAAPFSKDQSSEVWLLARIRFFLVPRRRIWDQSGVKQLVTVTAPRKIERQLTKNLTQTEVRSRLQALADTIDSRGWATKNVNVNLFAAPAFAYAQTQGSDRLVDPSSMPHEVPAIDTQSIPDMMDVQTSSTAQHLTQMIDQSAQMRRQQMVQMVQQGGVPPQQPTAPPDYWFLNGTTAPPTQAGMATFGSNPIVAPGMTAATQPAAAPVAAAPSLDDNTVMEQLKEANRKAPHTENDHLPTIQPLSKEHQARGRSGRKIRRHRVGNDTPPADPNQPVTRQPDLAILSLANDNNRSVASLAREAQTARPAAPPDGEVVVSLH